MTETLQNQFTQAIDRLSRDCYAAEERLLKRVLDLEGFAYGKPGDDEWERWNRRVVCERSGWRLQIRIDGVLKYEIVTVVSVNLAVESSRQEIVLRIERVDEARAAQ